MEFRLASAGDLPQVMGLWDYCFEKKEDPFFQWYFREYCLQHNKVVGGFDEESGTILSSTTMSASTRKAACAICCT